MGRAAGGLGDLVDLELVDLVEAALHQQVDEGQVPIGVERGLQRLRGTVDLAGGDGARLAGGTGFRGRVAPGDQELGNGLGGVGQQRHGRLVGQTAGAEDQHALVQLGDEATDRLAQLAHPAIGGERRRHRVDDDRDHRIAVDAAGQLFQGLGAAVVHLQAVRQGDIDVAVEHVASQFQGQLAVHRQRAGLGQVVAHRLGGGGDHERRHQVVEQAVVVVRREDHDQLGIEGLDLGTGLGQRRIDFGDDSGARVIEATQGSVRQAFKFYSHETSVIVGDHPPPPTKAQRVRKFAVDCRCRRICGPAIHSPSGRSIPWLFFVQNLRWPF
ncbi:hypothetical protein D3C75_780660 [compost metagenome]